MDKEDLLTILMVGLILFISYRMYLDSDYFQLTCIVSTVDGDKYCVRERDQLQPAADLLASTSKKMVDFVSYMKDHQSDDPRTGRLSTRFNASKIVETLPTSEYTAYSENKGKKIALCLNKRKEDNNQLIDPNTLMFVALHELAHLTTTTIGHNDEFWTNFKYLLTHAVAAGVYEPIDYKENKTDYCGMTIHDNPYFK
jgi:hypothetical protein